MTPTGPGAPILEGTLDPESSSSEPGGPLTLATAPGTYTMAMTALAVTGAAAAGDPDGVATVRMGGCAATVELDAEHATVEVVAVMGWDSCGIVINPRHAVGAARPELADPITQDGSPPRFRPDGAATATATANGIRLELWVKDASLERGQTLLAHLRVTNVGKKAIQYQGLFEDLRCPPLRITADTSALFDPGRPWTGVAAVYKDRFLRDEYLLRAPMSIPRRDRGPGCSDIGRGSRLDPGQVVEVPLAGVPSYSLEDQPLPPGTIHLSATFEGPTFGGPGLAAVSTDVTLAGKPVDYPSPGQLVDAALSTPGFIDSLERGPDPQEWANAHIGWWQKPPYPPQPRLAAGRDAPDGLMEIMQFFASDGHDFVIGVALDPWTGESFGSYGW